MRFPYRAFLVGLLFAAVFSYVTMVAVNRQNLYLPATQISSISIFFCILLAVGINPLLGLFRRRRFDRREIFLIFIMATVPAGLPVFGFVCEVVPMAGALHHPEWNTAQSGWNENVVPYVKEDYFLGAPLFGTRDVKDWPAFLRMLKDGKTPPAAYVWKELPDGAEDVAEEMLTGPPVLTEDDQEKAVTVDQKALNRQTAFAADMRAVLQREDFYNQDAFAGVSLPEEATALLARERLFPYETRRLNRMVLEAAFPDHVRHSRFLDDQQALRDYVRGLKAADREAFPVFLKRNDETASAFFSRFARYFTCTPAVDAEEVKSWNALLTKLYGASQDEGTSPARAVWDRLPADMQELVATVAREGWPDAEASAENLERVKEEQGRIAEALDAIVSDKSLLDGLDSAELDLSGTARKLMAKRKAGPLGENQSLVLSRLTLEAALPGAFKTYDIRFWGETPWSAWLGPVGKWFGLGALILILFYALNELIFRQWYEREKLIFPLAALADTVLGSEEGQDGRVPAVFREPLFWLGFAIAFGVIFYNGMVGARWIEGLSHIDLGGNSWHFKAKLQGTALEGMGPRFRMEVFFTVIGLAFLLPVEVSFSVWFFYIFMMIQQLVAVWMGYGTDGSSFSANWIDRTNFMTAQGGGAMEVFGFICLWKVRHYILAALFRLVAPKGSKGISAEEVKAYTIPSALFLLSSAGLIWFFLSGGVGWGMVLVTYFGLLFMTIALVRLVAECGIIGFQAWFGPTHIMKIFGLFRWPALFAAKGIGAIMMPIAALFLDVKTFVAPTMMNGKYLAARNRITGGQFALSLVLAVGVTLVVAAMTGIALAYDLGVGSNNGWFFSGFPKTVFNLTTSLMSNVENVEEMQSLHAEAGWALTGAALCGIILFLRQFLFWIPHPIGLVMFVNPLMNAYWFSFFLAWLFKRTAVKYCDADQYARVKAAFVGLIVGEVVAIAIALLLALSGYDNMGLGFNRN